VRISLRFRTAAARIPGAGVRNRSGFPALPLAAVTNENVHTVAARDKGVQQCWI
jgi:hypothetical protein